jgi:SAM-dependent methyltransferase
MRMNSPATSVSPAVLPESALRDLAQQAEAAFNADRFDEAANLYRLLLASQFSPGVMLWRLGAIANIQGDFDKAWELFHQAIRVDPRLAAAITPPEVVHHHLACRTHFDTEAVDACPVCGSSDQQPMMVVCCLDWDVYHPAFSPVRRWVQCSDCGHGFANPRPTAAAMAEAFRDPPPAHLMTWQSRTLPIYSDIINRLWQRRPGGDWLDVGVASGGMAAVAMDFGYRVTGLDIHSGYADHVRRMGIEFLLGDICNFDFAGRQFDVVCLGDVIEHVADPGKVIQAINTVLKPQGVAWLSTPNYEGAWTRAMRHKDVMWREGEHLQYFSLRSLKRLLEDHGLKTVDYHLSKRFIGCAEVTIERQ